MKKLKVLLLFMLISIVTLAQIQDRKIGKVHYITVPHNKNVMMRDDSIAKSINEYINKNAPKDFPDVLLYIADSDSAHKQSNFEEVLVFYQKYGGELFNRYHYSVFNYGIEHIGISLFLFRNHGIWGIEAIKYAVNNFDKLKEKEKLLSEKIRQRILKDADLDDFYLFRRGY